MDNTREQIYLAALLHDIGKFYQRADTGSVKTSRFLSEHGKVESVYCPLNKDGIYTHKHVLWTAQFFEDYGTVFNKLTHHKDEESLESLAASHHLNTSQLSDNGKIIKEADCLSSGMDRDSDLAYKDEQDELASWDAFKKKSMVSILETVGLSREEIANKKMWLHQPVRSVALEQSFFPIAECQTPDYASLWKNFTFEFGLIQADTYHAFSETLLNLLFKYTSCIPSSTINFPDVSLYDHAKTTAALAVCLYDVKASKEVVSNPFLLIGGDFSGIQPYIYQIVSKYASKNLKGRSFYLRLLSDVVVRYLLKELNLYKANIVYNSGGSFYLLAPNTSFVKQKLSEAIEYIEQQIFKAHGTTLYVAIDSIELSKDALLHTNDENLGKSWGELFEKRDKKKNCKFVPLIQGHYQDFFEPIMRGGETARDIITGEEFLPGENICKEGELTPLKKGTMQQIELGTALSSSDVMVVAEEEIPYWKDRTHIIPIGLDFTYYLINWKDLEEMQKELRASADKVTVVTLNGENGNCEFMRDSKVYGVNNIYSLEFYGGNEMNCKNRPTYEEMCEGVSDDSFKRLGVLRMDVDNLGYIFQKGILPERSTLSRFAALSRSFDYFFSGYLNTIWREVAPELSSIVYSGGDDVFIVGRWDKAIALAERIRNDFKEFTCHNKAFSISGGVAIILPTFPIMKGADESEVEERLAKGHISELKDKNSISFMDTPLNWDTEFPQVKSLKGQILDACTRKDNPLPKSFITKVLSHAANAEISEHKFSKRGVKTYWMLTYDLSRLQGRTSEPLIERCKTEVCGNKKELNGMPIDTKYHPLELWAFACRWAELELRTLNI